DDTKDPHSGIYATATVEAAGLGGDAQFVKATGRGVYYQTLSEELNIVGLISGGAGHVQDYGSDKLRVFDHFKGSDRLVRGFEYDGIGPVDALTGDHL